MRGINAVFASAARNNTVIMTVVPAMPVEKLL